MNAEASVARKKEPVMKAQWFHILLSVVDGPRHGAAIMEEAFERTEGSLRLWPGALYGSLSELAERGWIRETKAPEHAPTEGGRRRFWSITAVGKRALLEEVARLEALVRSARAKRQLRGEPA
jgi:DNA-binding PadR family transcriptional regulator